MKQKKKMKIIGSVVAVLVVVVVLGIAYAGFTEQLNINGEGIVKSSTWKIKFANLKEAKLTGTAKEITKPSINSNDTKIGDYEVTLTSPGDSVSYSFEVVNEGTYDAKISSIYIPTPECTGSGDNAVSDAENVCNRLKYTLTYSNGVKIQTGDRLSSKERQKMTLTLTYGDTRDPYFGGMTPEELAKSDVTVSNLSIALIYAQNGNAVEGSGSTQTYQAYNIGDQVQVAGENYYVIEDSGVNQDYVTLLKEEPLLYSEIKPLIQSTEIVTQVEKDNPDNTSYLKMAYLYSDTCYSGPGGNDFSGCTTDYNLSSVKQVVDVWSDNKFKNNELKEVNRYKARLIRVEELKYNLGYNIGMISPSDQGYVVTKSTPTWVYNYEHWTMSQPYDSKEVVYKVSNSILSARDIYRAYYIRPVINTFKSSL